MKPKWYFWLTRDENGKFYNIYKEKPIKRHDYISGHWESEYYAFCAEGFEPILPEKYHLKPGGGPIKVEFK